MTGSGRKSKGSAGDECGLSDRKGIYTFAISRSSVSIVVRTSKQTQCCLYTKRERRGATVFGFNIYHFYIINVRSADIYHYRYYILYFVPCADRAVRVTNCSENCGLDLRFVETHTEVCTIYIQMGRYA